MNFTDRTALGNTLALKVQQFRNKGAVVLCLQESSLLTCLTIASQLRAYVYPLIYAPLNAPNQNHTLLGAFDQDGNFCRVPETYKDGVKESLEIETYVFKEKPAAMKSITAQLKDYDMKLDKGYLNGRDVIIAGDVLTSALPLVVAENFLKGVSPKSVSAVFGNVAPEVAELARLSASTTEILDVLSGIVFDDNHYFEHSDSYTIEQKKAVAKNISAYWK